MTSIHKAVRLLAVAALLGAGVVGTSEGAIISVQPSTQTIAPADTASIDIVVSGLADDEVVGAFSLLLSFDPTLLGIPNSFNNDPARKMGLPGDTLDLSNGFPGGGGSPLDLFYLADVNISSPDLKTAEGTGFVLATVSFTGVAEGLSPLRLSFAPTAGAFLSNYDGVTAIPVGAVRNGSVCVDNPQTPGDPCAAVVPEPATLALSLLGAGVAALMTRRRRQPLSSN